MENELLASADIPFQIASQRDTGQSSFSKIPNLKGVDILFLI